MFSFSRLKLSIIMCSEKKVKEKKWQYGCEQYKDLPEDEK